MLSDETQRALRQQYYNSESWRIRHDTHERYTFPRRSFVAWMMDLIPFRGDEKLLDAGCGPGRYYTYLQQHQPNVRYYGLDYSEGMLAEHPAPERVVRGDMNAIPYPDNTFDIVMANHVMYLVGNIDAALDELTRVLKPGGILVMATSSQDSMPQFRELFRRAILLVSPPGSTNDIHVPETMHQRFALENGSRILARHFYAVVRHDLPSTLVFPEVDPIMSYLEATRAVREPQLPDGVHWDQVMLIMREQLNNLIMSLSSLAVDKLTGVLMASDTGGFIREYVSKQDELHDGDTQAD
jgi:SAM-dependent methyltransferase